jgi:uncharacterized protein YdaU (DUF1376 family)
MMLDYTFVLFFHPQEGNLGHKRIGEKRKKKKEKLFAC